MGILKLNFSARRAADAISALHAVEWRTGRLSFQFILIPAWFMRGISSGLDWDVWHEERPSTVAVRDRRRMERIIVFMVLLCVLFGFLRGLRKKDW